jgi:hypothetical protein
MPNAMPTTVRGDDDGVERQPESHRQRGRDHRGDRQPRAGGIPEVAGDDRTEELEELDEQRLVEAKVGADRIEPFGGRLFTGHSQSGITGKETHAQEDDDAREDEGDDRVKDLGEYEPGHH